MSIHEADIAKARAGDNHAMVEVLEAHLYHMRAVADLLVVASSDDNPNELNNMTVMTAAQMIEAEAGKAMDILSVWADSKQKGVAA